MGALYFLNVTLHVLAALLWLGGMFFVALVGAPLLRGVEPPQLRQRLFHQLGSRFRTVGWASIAVLLATGTMNLYFKGWIPLMGQGAFWRSALGHTLAAKLAAVAIMVTVSAIHDFVDGPRAGRVPPGSPESLRLRRRASMMARVNAIVGLILVVVAVRLARGG
ncbi:MAG: DUF4149 domain-containing protein [Gemmatimonadaceae bacterium]